MNSDEDEEYKLLVTRASVNQIRKQELSATASSTPKRKSNYLGKFISCRKHTEIVRLSGMLNFSSSRTTAMTEKEKVLGYLFYLNLQDMGQKNNNVDVRLNLMLHWISANVSKISH